MSSTTEQLKQALDGIQQHLRWRSSQTARTPSINELRSWADAFQAVLKTTFQPHQDLEDPRPQATEVARLGDMDTTTALRVGLDGDGDVYLSTTDNVTGHGIEFCTTGSGGGKSSRTHQALIALMVAMEADNAQDPRRDWWARRNGHAPID